MEHMTLAGAEQVSSAGHAMERAADEMRRAANTFAEALLEHQRCVAGMLEQLQPLLDAAKVLADGAPEKPLSTSETKDSLPRYRMMFEKDVEGYIAALQAAHQAELATLKTAILQASPSAVNRPSDRTTIETLAADLEHDMRSLVRRNADEEAEVERLQAELAKANAERDRETERTDIVIAEFDAPWPHSHTVAERLKNGLVWKIHECRHAVENRAYRAETSLEQVKEQITALRGLDGPSILRRLDAILATLNRRKA